MSSHQETLSMGYVLGITLHYQNRKNKLYWMALGRIALPLSNRDDDLVVNAVGGARRMSVFIAS